MISEVQAQQADVFSVFCRQLTASLGEHLITPLIDDVLLCFLPFGLLSADVPQAATASGALLVFTRPAYRRVGGFAAVRGELTEDVAIARRTRQAGLKLGLVLGAGWHLIVYTLPWVLAPRRPGWLVPLGLGVAERSLIEIKTEGQTVWQALLVPLSPLAGTTGDIEALSM